MSSTVRLRRLSQELVRLRKEAGLTVDQVTALLRWSTGKLTYMEQNKWVKAGERNVTQLLDLYKVKSDIRAAVLDLVQRSQEKDWWHNYRDAFPLDYAGFEDAATSIKTFEGLLVPGLLQTKSYASAVIRAGQTLTAPVVERTVEARLARQGILHREDPPAPEYQAVIDEGALLRSVGGPEVMREQLLHLADVSELPNVTIRVIPRDAGAYAAMTGAFVILGFGTTQDVPVVYLEGATASQFMEKPEDVQRYTLVFDQVATSALSPEESRAYVAKLRNHHT